MSKRAGNLSRRGTQVPWRWWENTGIDWKSAREKAAAQGGENEAEPDMTGLGLESDSEPEPTPGGTVGGTGEEASLGASGSSGAGRRIDQTGGEHKA